jgi:hypothetical protein
MLSTRLTCPSCKKTEDRKAFEQYKISVTRTMGFTRPYLDVVVCPSCGIIFVPK